MAISAEQRAALEAEAKRRGIDPQKLIAAAEESASTPAGSASATTGGNEQPKLFQYHLPFVTVREVRQRWLGLTDPFDGDAEVAADWAAKHGGSSGSSGA